MVPLDVPVAICWRISFILRNYIQMQLGSKWKRLKEKSSYCGFCEGCSVLPVAYQTQQYTNQLQLCRLPTSGITIRTCPLLISSTFFFFVGKLGISYLIGGFIMLSYIIFFFLLIYYMCMCIYTCVHEIVLSCTHQVAHKVPLGKRYKNLYERSFPFLFFFQILSILCLCFE